MSARDQLYEVICVRENGDEENEENAGNENDVEYEKDVEYEYEEN